MSHETPNSDKKTFRGPRRFRDDRGPRGDRGFHGSPDGRRPERTEVKHVISGPVEEAVYVLDILPTGNPMDRLPTHLRVPIIIGIGNKFFSLLEVEIKRKNPDIKLQQRISLEKTEDSPLKAVKRRIKFEDLSPTSKNLLESTIEHIIRDDEHRFVEFFNNAHPITTRKHQLQLLPGVGKKILWDFINAHKQKPFDNFQDIQTRVSVMPISILAKRIIEELETVDEKYRLFTRAPPGPSGS